MFTKNLNPGFFFFFFFGGGGGGGGGGGMRGDVARGYEHESRHILYAQHTFMTSCTKLCSLVKKFLMVFKIEGIVALTVKGK